MENYSCRIGYNEFEEVHDYWFIQYKGEDIDGTWSPNETMARRWLSMKHLKLTPIEIDYIITKAKEQHGS